MLDCNNETAISDWVGDGFCDNGIYDIQGHTVDLNCSKHSYDGGDCLGIAPTIMTGSCDNDDGMELPFSFLGDGVCDDGSYNYSGFAVDLNCLEFDFDSTDCCKEGYNGSAPQCVNECKDALGDPPVCWMGNNENRTAPTNK